MLYEATRRPDSIGWTKAGSVHASGAVDLAGVVGSDTLRRRHHPQPTARISAQLQPPRAAKPQVNATRHVQAHDREPSRVLVLLCAALLPLPPITACERRPRRGSDRHHDSRPRPLLPSRDHRGWTRPSRSRTSRPGSGGPRGGKSPESRPERSRPGRRTPRRSGSTTDRPLPPAGARPRPWPARRAQPRLACTAGLAAADLRSSIFLGQALADTANGDRPPGCRRR